MGFAFEGYATAEFKGGVYSCAGGLAVDVVGFLPSFLPNTTSITSPFVRNALLSPGEGCIIDLGARMRVGCGLWAVGVGAALGGGCC